MNILQKVGKLTFGDTSIIKAFFFIDFKIIFSYLKSNIYKRVFMFGFKKYIILLFSIGLIVSCDSMENPINSGPNNNQIKTIEKWLIDIETQAKESLISYKEYDISGHLIKHLRYDYDGHLANESTFEYNDSSSLELKLEYNDNGNVLDSTTFIYLYNEDGDVVHKITVNDDGSIKQKETYFYDQNGEISKQVLVSNGETFEKNISYYYNNKGILISREISEGDNIMVDSLFYKTSENVVSVKNYNINGNLDIVKTYYYNNLGQVVKEIHSNHAGEAIREYIFEYTFF